MKIGVMGGSFNPIHNGHINLAENAITKLGLDKLLIVPVGNPCHKPSKELVLGEHRINMCRLAFKDNEKVSVSDFEVNRTENSYTTTTIHKFKIDYPNDDFYLIMGSDMFFSFDKWFCYNELKKMVTVCVAARNQEENIKISEYALKYMRDGVKVQVIECNVIELSSTQVRNNISLIETSDKPLVIPEKVVSYIKQNGLYGFSADDYIYKPDDYIKILKPLMDEKRFNHSLMVSKRAEDLARIYNCNVNHAATAGILHDICKRIDYDEQLKWIKKSDIMWDNATLKQESILHGISGAEYIQEVLGIYNIDIINGIRNHTTGRPNMTLFEKVIFIADLTSDDRVYDNVDFIKQLSETNLDNAIAEVIRFNMVKVINGNYPLSELTVKTYNYYCVK